jgi:hypothetical protein
VPALEYGMLRPGTGAAVQELTFAFYVVGLAVLSVIGILTLVGLVRRRRGRDAEVVDAHYAGVA